MIRCFMSDHSLWMLDLDANTYARTPRDESMQDHPGVPYVKTQGMRPLLAYTVWTKDEACQHPEHHNAVFRSSGMGDGDLYLWVCEPSGSWIDTIVREVFP